MTRNQAFEILKQVSGIRAARVITDNVKNLTDRRVRKISRLLQRGVPVAKIIHQKWFFGIEFYTNMFTLDPRPDTETLVETVISDYNDECRHMRILDLGTGTGCVLVALVKNIKGAIGVGVDKSWRAIMVAKKNVRDLDLKKIIKIKHADFTRKIKLDSLFDVIVSNPPYIANGDRRIDRGAMYDPKIALYASDNGLGAYKVIARNAKNWLKKNGRIYLEIGQGQADSVKHIFVNNGWDFVRVESDLAGIERVLVFERV